MGPSQNGHTPERDLSHYRALYLRSASEAEREELRDKAGDLASPTTGPTTFGAVIEYLVSQVAPGGRTMELRKGDQLVGVVVHPDDLQGLQAAQRSAQPAWIRESHYLSELRRREEASEGRVG